MSGKKSKPKRISNGKANKPPRGIEIEPHQVREAIDRAVGNLIAGILSEPMTLEKLARMYGIGRNNIRPYVESMDGHERIGGKFRVPIIRTTPAYLRKIGLI